MINTDLSHLTESKQRTLGEIKRLILNEVDTWAEGKANEQAYGVVWLVLFGSYARGTQVRNKLIGHVSDFDILVVVQGVKLLEDYQLWGDIEEKLSRLSRIPINIIVHTQDEIVQRLSEGHYFFSDIRDQGIYLYSKQPKGMPAAKNLTNAEWLPIAEKHYAYWLESADGFLDTHFYDLEKGRINQAAFLLHQATERFYACTLLVLSNYRPHTHNLKLLRHLAIERTGPDSPFANIFPGETRFQRRSFARLKRAYVDARYSEHFEITEEELAWLAEQVAQLKGVTKHVCDAHIRWLGEGGEEPRGKLSP